MKQFQKQFLQNKRIPTHYFILKYATLNFFCIASYLVKRLSPQPSGDRRPFLPHFTLLVYLKGLLERKRHKTQIKKSSDISHYTLLLQQTAESKKTIKALSILLLLSKSITQYCHPVYMVILFTPSAKLFTSVFCSFQTITE